MATQEEIIKLVLQVQGQGQASDLRNEVSRLTKEMQELGPAVSANDPKIAALATRMLEASRQADELDKKFGKAGSGASGFGQSMLQTGRVLQDFTQGGIGGVLNNVEGLSMALGGGAGLAGLMTALGVAAFIAKPYLNDIAASLGLITKDAAPLNTELETITDRIKALNEKKIKTTVDRIELDNLNAKLKETNDAIARYHQLQGLKPKAEGERDADLMRRAAESGVPVGAALAKQEEERIKATDETYLKLKKEQDDAKAAVARFEDMLAGINAETGGTPEDALNRMDRRKYADSELQRQQARMRNAGIAVGAYEKQIEDPKEGLAIKAAGKLKGDDLEQALNNLGLLDNARAQAQEQILRSVGQWWDKLGRKLDDVTEKEAAKITKEADKQAEASRKEAEKNQTDFEKEQSKQEADRQGAIERAGGHAASKYGPAMNDEIELAINRNRNSANPENDATFRFGLAMQVNDRLRRAGATDANGQPLGAEARAAAANRIVGGATEDLSRRTLMLQSQGINEMRVGAMIDAQLMSGLQANTAGLNEVRSIQQRVLQGATNANRTALRRGR